MKFYRKFIPMLILALIIQIISPVIFNDKAIVQAGTSGPVVSYTIPSFVQPGNPTSATLELIDVYFDESIQKYDNTKKITILNENTGATVGLALEMSSTNISIVNNNVLRIRLNQALSYSTNYFVRVEAGAVKNSRNQPLAADYIGKFTSISNDNTPPTIKDIHYMSCPIDPQNGQVSTACSATEGTHNAITTNLNATNTSFKLNFSEAIRLGTGVITLRSSDDVYNETIDVSSGQLTGSGHNAISFAPPKTLLPNKTYYLTIAASNFKDEAQNILASPVTYRFTTASDAITMVGTPSSGATDVVLDENGRVTISMRFNSNVNVRAVANKGIKIYNTRTNQLLSNTLVTSSTAIANTFTYTPNIQLSPGTDYNIRIDKGSFVSTDGLNVYRGIDAANEWQFKTKAVADTQRPYLTSRAPAHNASNVPLNELIVLKFNEPVYAVSGAIAIKEYNSNMTYRTFDVSSLRITGLSTNTITINPHSNIDGQTAKTYNQKTRYYVDIPDGVFRDSTGNTNTAIGKNNYYFSVGESMMSKPLLTQLSPINGDDMVIAGTPKFTLEFDRAVSINDRAAISAQIKLKNGNANSPVINMTATQVAGEDRKITLNPDTPLSANTEYYINVPSNLIEDYNNIYETEAAYKKYYDGILNTYQWTFKTLGGDTEAPKLIRSESNGNKIRLVYDELLSTHHVPERGAMFITVNGVTKSISTIHIEKNAAIITMYEQLNATQQILVSYTKPTATTASPIRDITGNAADSFFNQEVIYGQLTASPTVVSSSYSGRNITLEFNEPLQKINSFAYLQFSANVNGTNNAATSISHSGNKVILGVSSTIANNRNVVVTYNKNAYPLQGFNNDVNSFNVTIGQGNSVPIGSTPAVSSISATGSEVVIAYNQAVNVTPAPSQYVVYVNGGVRSVTSTKLEGQSVMLTLSSAINTGDTVQVSYTTSGMTLLSSGTTGLYAPSFQNMTANLSVASGKLALQGAILKGDKITMTFNKPLDTNYIPLTNQFYILIDGNNWTVRQVNVEGSKVILTLPSSVKVGVEGSLTYYTTSDTLRSTDGERASGVSNFRLANQTTVIDVLSDEYTVIDSGVLLKETTASKSTAQSPSGKSVTQYNVDNAKITTAIDSFADAGLDNVEIRFEVPTSQQAAVVAFPMAALQNAARKGNFIFSVKYGDIYYQVPTDSVDITNAVTLNKGSAFTNNLILKVETGSNSKTSQIESAINSSGGTLISGPFLFEATIDGPTGSSQLPLKGNLIRKVLVPRALDKSQTGAVHYDEVANNISGMPTTFVVSGNTTEVTFMRPGTSAYAIVSSNKTYTDLGEHWARHSILILSRKSIIEGHTATTFSPQKNITRGEFASYLVKGLGLSANKEEAKKFIDVDSNTTLGGYIGAAAKAGIVSGVSANEFKPNAPITRQDMAIMMMRVVNYTKMDISLTNTPESFIGRFTDGNKVSSYARAQVGQAIQIGIITGFTPTTISPLNNATRAEGITMIERVLRKADYLQ